MIGAGAAEDDGVFQVQFIADMNRLAIAEGAMAALCGKQFVPVRIENPGLHDSSVFCIGKGDCAVGIVADEVHRAIDRIKDPDRAGKI